MKGRNSSILYLSLKKSISPRSVVTASNVSLGSQVLGVLGPVGWIVLSEGPGKKKKKAFYKDKSTVILYCISAFLRMVKCLHIKRKLPDHHTGIKVTVHLALLIFFFFLIRVMVIFRDSSRLNCEVKKFELNAPPLKILIPSLSPLLLPLSAFLVT